MSVTDEIKARLDLVNYIQQYVPLKKAGRTFKACCPFHNENTPSFVVDPVKGYWRCYGACAEGGDLFNFAMRYHGWTFKEALETLARDAGVQLTERTDEQIAQDKQKDKLYGLMTAAAEMFHRNLLSPAGQHAYRYATEKRAFTQQTIEQFQIGYALDGWQHTIDELTQLGYSEKELLNVGLVIHNEDKNRTYDRFRNRLMIPIRDIRGRVIGFGARALNPDDNPKYLNSPQTVLFDKSRTLFGLDTGKNAVRDTETVVIVEGYMDAIQAQQAGFGNVVAQMGTAMTEEQLKLIAPKWAKRIVIALDSDAAGQNATLRSLEVARQTLQADYTGKLAVDVRILHIPDAKDPDDLIRETPHEWQSLIDNAISVADFVIDVETAHLSSDTAITEREEIARRLLPILLASENNLYQQENLQKLALRLRINERQLLAIADDERKKTTLRPRQNNAHSMNMRDTVTRDNQPAQFNEPPPLDIDQLEPPMVDFEEDIEVFAGDYQISQASIREAVKRSADHPSEGYCLRLLLNSPELLYEINRSLRQLARSDENLLVGPLNEFGAQDFVVEEHRTLIHILKLALREDVVDLNSFLQDNIDSQVLGVVEHLTRAESDFVRDQIKGRFDGDAAAKWDEHEQRVIASVDVAAQAIGIGLKLRLMRLQREIDEARYLQTDMQDDVDLQESIGLGLAYMSRARGQIESELKQRGRNVV